MHIQIPHKTSKRAAIDRVKVGLLQAKPHMKDQVAIEKQEWEGNKLHFAFTTQGKQVIGTLVVTDSEFVVDARLPLLWRMFEGKIEKMIMEQAQGMLGRP